MFDREVCVIAINSKALDEEEEIVRGTGRTIYALEVEHQCIQ